METVIQYLGDFFGAFVGLSLEMAPYLMLGFLFAGILYVWFPKKKVYKYLGKPNAASVINASLIGIPLPLCSCGVIPTGISFYNSGASKGSSTSFLISTPQTGVDSILVTYSLLGLPMAIIRPVIALFTGVFGGFLTNFFDTDRKKGGQQKEEAINENNIDRSLPGMLRYGFVEFMEDIAKWLVIGLLIAALIAIVVPETFFTAYIGNQYLEMALVLVAAIPLYVCATGSVPIAAMLMLKGLSPGAAIVFLMAGPATNAATMTVIGKVFGRKSLLIYLFSIITGSLFFGILVNEFLPREWFLNALTSIHGGEHAHDILPGWLHTGSGIVLGLLVINALLRKYFPSVFKPEKKKTTEIYLSMKNNEIIVTGMTCNHCKAIVEENVGKLDGIDRVEADINKNRVKISGKDYDLEKVKEKIESLGYNYGGPME